MLDHFTRILRLKLERCERFRHEGRTAHRNLNAFSFWSVLNTVKQIYNSLCKFSNSDDIFICLRRKPHHKVEFNCRISAFKSDTAGIHYFFFGNIFIYNVTQTLCSALCRKRKSTFADTLYLLKERF